MTDFKSGLELHKRGEFVKAKRIYEKILQSDANHFDALHMLGVIALQQGNPSKSAEFLVKALQIKPDNAPACSNLGNALTELGRLDDALLAYDQAVHLDVSNPIAYYNRANVLVGLNQLSTAILNYQKAIEYDPHNPIFYYNLGNTLKDLNCFAAAENNYAKCIALDDTYVDAYVNRGNVLVETKNFREAIKNYQMAVEMDPSCVFLPGILLHTKMKVCDWSGLSTVLKTLASDIASLKKIIPPLSILSLLDSPTLHKKFSKTYTEVEAPGRKYTDFIGSKHTQDKITIGYYSADFRSHAVSYLIAGMIEAHDKERFKLVAFSFNSDNQNRIWGRIRRSFDEYVDVSSKTDEEVIRLSRDLGIDIAINLNGHTKGSRNKIFAARCAPVQVNYLGYPGTMGAEYMDYIIADRTIIPSSRRNNFVEKVAYMPHCYQPNDCTKKISDKVYTRGELGLPDTGFVFCCFNNLYKILPNVFDSWMKILKATPGSVLWLKADSGLAQRNIIHEALTRDVEGNRIVFAKYMPRQKNHLARHRVADLYLDTFPFTAHTTASDALWAEVPVLTRVGKSYASRVSASLLFTIGLPELVTRTAGQYERMAISLAKDSDKLSSIKNRLVTNRLMSPLFDTLRFTRDIEKLYTRMYERYQEGLPPKHII